MKLIFKEIKSNFRNMFMFIVFLSIVSIFCFQVLASGQIIENENYDRYHKNMLYRFDLKNIDENYLIDLSKKEYFDFFEIKSSLPKNFKLDTNFITDSKPKKDVYIVSPNERRAVQKGIIPKISDKDDIIAIPMIVAINEDIKLNAIYNVNGVSAKVVAFTDLLYDDAFVMPLNLAKKMNLKIENVIIQFKENVSDVQKKSILDEIGRKLDTKYEIANIKTFFDNNEKARGYIILTVSLSLLALIFIYNHALNQRKDKYFIYRFLGMGKWQFYKMLLSELIVYFLFSFVAGLMIFTIIDSVILKGIFQILRYDLKLNSILMVFVILMTLLLVTMFINIRKYFNESIVQKYKS